jgi:tetratricopeptide (TPR) repeat protein
MSDDEDVLTDPVRATRRLGHYFVEKLRNLERRYRDPRHEKFETLAEFDREWPQLEQVFETLAPLIKGDTQIAEICSFIPVACPSIFLVRLPGERWAQWLKVGMAATRQLNDWKLRPSAQHQLQLLGELGNAYMNCRRFRKAAQWFRKAVRVARILNDVEDEALWLGNLAVVLAESQYLDQALKTSEQVISLIGIGGNQRLRGDQLRLCGTIHFDRSNFRKSLDCLFEALRIHSTRGDGFEIGIDLGEIGLSFMGQGDLRRAREFLTEARDTSRQFRHAQSEANWQRYLDALS